jgi:hypothetical protein
MMKRSFHLALAAVLIAGVAFSAPSQAGSTTVTTAGFFSLAPAYATASEWTFNFVDSTDAPLASMSGLSIISTGGGWIGAVGWKDRVDPYRWIDAGACKGVAADPPTGYPAHPCARPAIVRAVQSAGSLNSGLALPRRPWNRHGEVGEVGSFTIHFGGYDGQCHICLPIAPGWNYLVRLYRPRAETLDGTWKSPEAEPVR